MDGTCIRYIINNPGLVTESSYPYEAVTNVCRFNSSNVAGKISSYVILPNDEEILKNALSTVGPIATAIDATLDSFFTYSDGVYFDKACSQYLTHAVLLVGYGTDPEYGDYWICKNSWVIFFISILDHLKNKNHFTEHQLGRRRIFPN